MRLLRFRRMDKYIYKTKNTNMNKKRTVAEYLMVKRLITEVYPKGIVSLVSDTFDLWAVITKILPTLKEEILARDGRVVVRPDCFTDDTMILTPHGWSKFSDLTNDSLVAQVEDDGSYVYVKPLKIFNEYYNGDVYHFKDFHGKMDLVVTPNHRMVYKKGDMWITEQAEKIKPQSHLKSFIRSSNAQDKKRNLTFLERLNIAFQADGSYITNTKSSIRFSFSKQRKIDRMEKLLNSNEISYKKYTLSNGIFEFNIKFNSELLHKNFDWVDTSDLCSNWCKEFIEELSHWDSTIRSENRIKFDTTNKSVVDVVELVALSAGYGCYISKHEDYRKLIFSDVYTANILKNNKLGGQAVLVDKMEYSGNVVCVTVPSGRIVVKRNQCIMVCGNSGDPTEIICGVEVKPFDSFEDAEKYFYKNVNGNCLFSVDGVVYKLKFGSTFNAESVSLSPAEKGAYQLLWETFGGTINDKGYKELNVKVGLIYGDSITLERQNLILKRLEAKGFSGSNLVLGIGSFTYEYVTRDTFGGAMKATWGVVNGEEREIFKDPITDSGFKKSAKGLLKVYKDEFGILKLKDQCSKEEENEGELQVIFEDGVLYNETTFKEVKETLLKNLY